MAVELINTTGWAAFGFAHVLLEERPYYIVIVKQSWRVMAGGGLRALDQQRPIRPGDHFQGRPDFSAIDLPTDLLPYKPHGEIVLCGCARSVQARPQWDVEVSLGEWRKRLRVHGERRWRKGLSGWKLSDAQPTQRARLDYAGAYGGHFELPPTELGQDPLIVAHGANSGGQGWLGKGHGHVLTAAQKAALDDFAATASVLAPSVENPALPAHKSPPGHELQPQAFGALPAWSDQRLQPLRGMKPPAPDQKGYGRDFDMSHWQQTAPDQWLPKETLPGGVLRLSGVFEEGDAVYRLPKPQTLVHVRSRKTLNTTLDSDIDTLVLDVDERVLEVVERRLVPLEVYGDDAVIEVLQRAG